MRAWQLRSERAPEAVDILCRVFPDFPGSDVLATSERPRVAALLHSRTIRAGLTGGRIDAWGDPIVGVAVWLVRPALSEATSPGPTPATRDPLNGLMSADVLAQLQAFDAVMQRLRAIARPDRHVYLDMIGVVPEFRRRGIATALMAAGHRWAAGLDLPCALDTDTPENVAFYEGRGYQVRGRERIRGSDRELVAMRRDLSHATDGGIIRYRQIERLRTGQ